MISHCTQPTAAATTQAEWGISLASGTIAAVITGLVVYGVFLATRRTERDRDRAARTAASVSKVIEAASGFTMMTSTVDEFRVSMFEAQKIFTHSLLDFAAREIRDHRVVAGWAIVQAKDFAELVKPLLAKPEGTTDEYEALIDEVDAARVASRVAAALLRWLRDGTDKKFDPVLPPSLTDF